MTTSRQTLMLSCMRKIYDDELHAHFVAFSCYRRRCLLDNDRAKRVVLGVLNSQLSAREGASVGFVVMPDHVHAIVSFSIPGQLSVFMQQKVWEKLTSMHENPVCAGLVAHPCDWAFSSAR